MDMRRKTGIILILFCMAAILAVIWYCLFAATRPSSHADGTLVKAVTYSEETRMVS